MNEEEILDWLKANNPMSVEASFKMLRPSLVKRAFLREVWLRYRNWRSVQPYESHIATQRDMKPGRAPKVVFFDLEVSPWLGWGFEAYKGNILKIEKDSKILAFSWTYYDDPKVYGMTLSDYPDYAPDKYNIDDKNIVKDLHDILSSADVLVGQNSKKYDWRVAQARFWYYNFPPIKKPMHIDTLRTAKREFYLPKYTLGDQLRYKELGGKTKETYSDLVWDCLDGDKGAWKKMNAYCKNDTGKTKELYLSQRGFDTMHPNLSFFTRGVHECPVCYGKDVTEFSEDRPMRGGIRKNYRCKNCGKVFVGEILKDGYDKIKTYG